MRAPPVREIAHASGLTLPRPARLFALSEHSSRRRSSSHSSHGSSGAAPRRCSTAGNGSACRATSSVWSIAGRTLARGYLELIRNTPLLVQLFLFYFVIAPIVGVDRFWAGVLCISFFEGSFASEIIRGGLLAVPRGQYEAAAIG